MSFHTQSFHQTIVGNDVKDFIVNMTLRIHSRLKDKGQLTPDINKMLSAISYTISAQTTESMKKNLIKSRQSVSDI